MIVVTTAGTFLIEASHNPDLLRIQAESETPLIALIDQLELVGTHENPLVSTYDELDITFGSQLAYSLNVHRADVALFLQAEVLNFLRYRKFSTHADGLDDLGRTLLEQLPEVGVQA
jgi:hypothetical protein